MKKLKSITLIILIFSGITAIKTHAQSIPATQKQNAPGPQIIKVKRTPEEIASGDTSHRKWAASLVCLQSVYASKEQPSVKDTLVGTAFLVTDHDKLYLVTAKHLVQADLYGKDQQLANDSVFLSPRFDKTNMNISGLSGKDRPSSADVLFHKADNGYKSAVAFTGDEEDIAVISLQKMQYKNIATYLLTKATPIPIGLIDNGNNHQPGELLWRYGFNDLSLKEMNAKFPGMHVAGMSTYQVDQYDAALPYFMIIGEKSRISPGNNGGPVTANDKLIGMLSNATGITNNHDIIQKPNYSIRTGKVVKAAYILSCLRKLQQMEDEPGFN